MIMLRNDNLGQRYSGNVFVVKKRITCSFLHIESHRIKITAYNSDETINTITSHYMNYLQSRKYIMEY